MFHKQQFRRLLFHKNFKPSSIIAQAGTVNMYFLLYDLVHLICFKSQYHTMKQLVSLSFKSFSELWAFAKSAGINSMEINSGNRTLTCECIQAEIQLAEVRYHATLLQNQDLSDKDRNIKRNETESRGSYWKGDNMPLL